MYQCSSSGRGNHTTASHVQLIGFVAGASVEKVAAQVASYPVVRLVKCVVNCNLNDQQQEADKYGRRYDAAVATPVALLIDQVLPAQCICLSTEGGLK